MTSRSTDSLASRRSRCRTSQSPRLACQLRRIRRGAARPPPSRDVRPRASRRRCSRGSDQRGDPSVAPARRRVAGLADGALRAVGADLVAPARRAGEVVGAIRIHSAALQGKAVPGADLPCRAGVARPTHVAARIHCGAAHAGPRRRAAARTGRGTGLRTSASRHQHSNQRHHHDNSFAHHEYPRKSGQGVMKAECGPIGKSLVGI